MAQRDLCGAGDLLGDRDLGDRDLCGSLWRRANAMRHSLPATTEPDDLVQQTWLYLAGRVYRDAEHRAAVGVVRLRHMRLDVLRAAQREPVRRVDFDRLSAIEEWQEPAPLEYGLYPAELHVYALEHLAALARQPMRQGETLRLRAVEGLSYDEIGQQTGVPTGTVMSRIGRARKSVLRLAREGV